MSLNPRINITLDQNTLNDLSQIAKEENISVSSLSKKLIKESLEKREDRILSKIADQRDNENEIDHNEVWN